MARYLISNRPGPLGTDAEIYHRGVHQEHIGPKSGRVLASYWIAACRGRTLGGTWGQTELTTPPPGMSPCQKCFGDKKGA